MASANFINQSLGVFQPDQPKIEGALVRVPFHQRFQVGRYALLNLEGDPSFPASGAMKKIHYCISMELGSGKMNVHVAAVQCLFNGFPERDIYTALSGAKRVVQPLLIEWKDGFEYIISELFNQGSLASFLLTKPRGRLPLFLRDQIAYSVACAVLECHQRGVVLRDFKPQNVLAHELPDGTLDLKISDLGLGFLMTSGSKKESIQFIGTVGYKSPESWKSYSVSRASTPASYASDAWALGCFLYDLVLGVPFNSRLFKRPNGEAEESFRDLYTFCLGTYGADIRELLTRTPKWRLGIKDLCLNMNRIFAAAYPNRVDSEKMDKEWREIKALPQFPEAFWVIEKSVKEFLGKADEPIVSLISAFVLDL